MTDLAPDLVDVLSRATTEIIPIAGLTYLSNNPNRLDVFKKRQLVALIREKGFLQPVLVCDPGDGTRVMIDGVHRAEALVELAAPDIEAKVVQCSIETARLLRIALNNLRGELDVTSVAEELAELSTSLSMDELAQTGFDPNELERLLSLAVDVPDTTISAAPEPEQDAGQRRYTLSITFETEAQRTLVKARLLEAAGEDGSVAQGLLIVLGEAPTE